MHDAQIGLGLIPDAVLSLVFIAFYLSLYLLPSSNRWSFFKFLLECITLTYSAYWSFAVLYEVTYLVGDSLIVRLMCAVVWFVGIVLVIFVPVFWTQIKRYFKR